MPWHQKEMDRCVMKEVRIPAGEWYDLTHKCFTPQECPPASDDAEGVWCGECQRKFRRPGNIKRQNCRAEREKLVHEQKISTQGNK